MPTSIFIAKLLGPMFAVVGIALLLRPDVYRDILRDFIKSPALHYLAGFLGLLAGLALILTHNVWVLDWRLLITLIGWITVARAVLTIFRPHWIVPVGNAVLDHRGALGAVAAINLLLGIALIYFGYLA